MAAWYLIVGLLKLYILKHRNKTKKRQLLKIAGIAVIGLSVVLSGIVCMGIVEKRNPDRGLIVMIALAAYSFTMMTVSIIQAIRAGKTNDEASIVMKDISLVGAIASMLSLERGMLGDL